MCRWFLYVSAEEECLVEDVLVTPDHGLARMVNDHYLPGLIHQNPSAKDTQADREAAARNIVLNIDGMGLAWYTSSRSEFDKGCLGERPCLYKSMSPPTNDFNFKALAANICTKTLFAHIRAGSGGAVAPANSHPFVFGRHMLMHNGVISDFIDVRRQMCDLLDKDSFANIHGATDSEHLTALYMTYLTEEKGRSSWELEYSLEEMLKALCQAISTVIRLQKQVLGKNARPSSLNLAVTDGNRVICVRVRNHQTQQPPSLYYSTTAGVALNRKYPSSHDGSQNPLAIKKAEEHGKHIIVASEPTTYKAAEWKLIPKNSYIAVEKGGKVSQAALPWNDSLDIEDDTVY